MTASVSLSDLRSRVRWRADAESSPLVTDAVLNERINQAGRELYDLICTATQDHYYWKSNTRNTVANTAYISVHDDFYRLLGVDVLLVGHQYALERYEFNERHLYPDGANWSGFGPFPRYRLQGQYIYFVPPPDAVYTVTIHYVPTMTTMVDGPPAVGFDGVNGWDEYIVIRTAIMVMNKEESDTNDLWRELAHLQQRIESQLTMRDQARPRRVQSVVRERELRRDIWRWRGV